MKVLDQLSITSWLPATCLVGAAILLLSLDSMQRIDLAKALEVLGSLCFGVGAV